MKKLTLLAAAAVLFLCGNLAVFSQNKDSFQENISKNQSFSIDTDPSQIQLNLPETVQTEKSSGALSTVWIFEKKHKIRKRQRPFFAESESIDSESRQISAGNYPSGQCLFNRGKRRAD